MSVRLAKAMPHTSPEFWLKMQLNYDLSKAQKSRQPKIKPFPAQPQKELAYSIGITAFPGMLSLAWRIEKLQSVWQFLDRGGSETFTRITVGPNQTSGLPCIRACVYRNKLRVSR